MTLDQLKTLIKYLQCKQAKFANIVADKLSLGICSDDYLHRLVESSYILEIFYRYNPFLDDITTIQTLSIEPTTTTLNFEVYSDALVLATYSGTGDLNLMQQSILTQINSNTDTTGFYATIIDGILYIFYIGEIYSYADLLTVKFLTHSTTTYSSESQEDNVDTILDSLNCLTKCQLSALKDKFLLLIQ